MGVLVVDDDADIRQVMLVALEDEYEVSVCERPDELLVWLRGHETHECAAVILLDDHMPTMRGIEVLREIAADHGLRAYHHFVLMSADPHTARAALQDHEIGAVIAAVLIKPFDLDDLLDLVRREHSTLCR